MKTHQTFVKVRYSETDQMGVVHHGNYAQYLEIARIEWFEQFGVSYKKLEEEGIMLPVYAMEFKFLKPATFDEVLKIETKLLANPEVRIEFSYKIFNSMNEVITIASTVLVFMNATTKKPMRCPGFLAEKLKI